MGPLGPQGITLQRHNSSWVNCKAHGASAVGCWSAACMMLKPGGTHCDAPRTEMGSWQPPLPPPAPYTADTICGTTRNPKPYIFNFLQHSSHFSHSPRKDL